MKMDGNLYVYEVKFQLSKQSNYIRIIEYLPTGEQGVARSERVDKASISVSVQPSRPFADVFSLCRSIIENEAVYPLTIEIFGSGTIVTSQSEDIVDDLIWVRSTTLDILRISVATQSDIWLPFSLKGEPQDDIHRMKADRLANALQEIQQQTGFQLEEGVKSSYSVIKGFRLDNIRYSDGSIADVS